MTHRFSIARVLLDADLLTDDFTRHDDFNPAVLLSTRGGVVISNRLGLAKTLRGYTILRQSLFSQVAAHRIGTVLGELSVQFVASSAVRVAFDGEL